MRRQREHLGRRYGVKLWVPALPIMEIAKSRTRGMVEYYMCVGEQYPGTHNLRVLCASAYLQGIKDAVDAEMRQAGTAPNAPAAQT